MKRLIFATLCGSIVATVVLVALFAMHDHDDWITVTTLLNADTPQRLVLTPAILFVLVSAELAREAHTATLSLLALPAIVTGGAAMFWILSRWKIPQSVEAVFE